MCWLHPGISISGTFLQAMYAQVIVRTCKADLDVLLPRIDKDRRFCKAPPAEDRCKKTRCLRSTGLLLVAHDSSTAHVAHAFAVQKQLAEH